MLTRHPSLTEAYSPDADRAGQDASAHYEWLVHFLARIIVFLLEHGLATWHPRTPGAPSWVHDRPDLPPGSAQAEAAAIRGTFGRAIEWMCRRRGINPGHPDWPELARAIVAYGGSVYGFRPGLPALGLQWWENPNIVPDMIGMPAPTPAADAMVLLLSRKNDFAAPPPALHAAPAAAEPAVAPAPARPVLVRAGTGPPTGPPPDPHRQLCYAAPTGPRHGRPRHSDSCCCHAVAVRLGTRSNPAFSRRLTASSAARLVPAFGPAEGARGGHPPFSLPLRLAGELSRGVKRRPAPACTPPRRPVGRGDADSLGKPASTPTWRRGRSCSGRRDSG